MFPCGSQVVTAAPARLARRQNTRPRTAKAVEAEDLEVIVLVVGLFGEVLVRGAKLLLYATNTLGCPVIRPSKVTLAFVLVAATDCGCVAWVEFAERLRHILVVLSKVKCISNAIKCMPNTSLPAQCMLYRLSGGWPACTEHSHPPRSLSGLRSTSNSCAVAHLRIC